MVRLAGTLGKIKTKKVLVAGDLMLDTYTIGKARRISPEAPVAVLNVTKEECRPGGAGNAALNFISLGAEVVLLARIGNDNAGATLLGELEAEKIDVRGVFIQEGYLTPQKNRIIADNQQIVRVDHETLSPLSEVLEEKMIQSIPQLLENVSAVAISDYGKGLLSHTLLSSLIEEANRKKIPVITDPKGTDFAKYSGSTILKPNLSEAYAAAGMMYGEDLSRAAHIILKGVQIEKLMITRSEDGISIYDRTGSRLDFPVKVREVKDVTGAGDTVLATLTTGLASGLDLVEAVELSNIAAGIAIERFGCARITLADLARRLIDADVENKIFDQDHLHILEHALVDREYTVLSISGAQGMTSTIYSSIHQLTTENEGEVVVYINDETPDMEFVRIIASLKSVQFILLSASALSALTQAKKPKSISTISENEMSTPV